MFTGLVEATGTVTNIKAIDEGARLSLNIPFAAELTLGESVAINGCCLTVSELAEDATHFDILSQTMRVTSLGTLETGSRVNLERAMAGMQRFGGHFVMGHVDSCGIILSLEKHGQDHCLKVRIPEEYLRYCIDKGSITIDGISLTIANIDEDILEFWITPHTFAFTNLATAQIGQLVDIEVDMLAKYVEKLFVPKGE